MFPTRRVQKRLRACSAEVDKAILSRNINAVAKCIRGAELFVRTDEGLPSQYTRLLAILEVNPNTGEILEAVDYKDKELPDVESDIKGLVLDYQMFDNPNQQPMSHPKVQCQVRPEDASIELNQAGLSPRALHNIRQLNLFYVA